MERGGDQFHRGMYVEALGRIGILESQSLNSWVENHTKFMAPGGETLCNVLQWRSFFTVVFKIFVKIEKLV